MLRDDILFEMFVSATTFEREIIRRIEAYGEDYLDVVVVMNDLVIFYSENENFE